MRHLPFGDHPPLIIWLEQSDSGWNDVEKSHCDS